MSDDLLAACKEMLEIFEQHYPLYWHGTRHRARAAIAKTEHDIPERDAKIAELEAENKQLREENARLRNELTGVTKARDLLLAGMESQSELMDGLKQESRELASLRKKLGELVGDVERGMAARKDWYDFQRAAAQAEKNIADRIHSLLGGSGGEGQADRAAAEKVRQKIQALTLCSAFSVGIEKADGAYQIVLTLREPLSGRVEAIDGVPIVVQVLPPLDAEQRKPRTVQEWMQRYGKEPCKHGVSWYWQSTHGDKARFRLPNHIYAALTMGHSPRWGGDYSTRESAIADLDAALRAVGEIEGESVPRV